MTADKSQAIFTNERIKKLPYPTPYFLYSQEVLTDTIHHYKKTLPDAELYYALKANSEPEILRTIYQNDCGFEAASAYELNFLKKIGVVSNKIIYGTSVKPPSHIQDFVNYGIDRFAFDSEQELEKISKVSPRARVYVRVLVDDSGSVFTMSDKFGATQSAAVKLMLSAKKRGLKPYGVSFNVGSQALNPEAWSSAIDGLLPLIEELFKMGIKIEVLNLGGGYPNNYPPYDVSSLEQIATNIKKSLKRLPRDMRIMIEPGRGLVAQSMVLVAGIIAKIKRPNGHWLYLDAGTYNALLEIMEYQGSLQYSINAVGNFSGPSERYILTGPTGDSLDVINKEILLPAALNIGDKLLIRDTGAYSTVLATAFNGFPKIPIYKID